MFACRFAVSHTGKLKRNASCGRDPAEFGASGVETNLDHHGLLILLLLCDLDGRQLCHRGHQEVHEDVLTVGQLVHHVLQTAGYELGVEVMVIPVRRKRSRASSQPGDL